MAKTHFKGTEVHTNGNLPTVGSIAPDFTLVRGNLSDCSLSEFRGKKVIMNIFPSIDTGVCATSVRRFNKEAAALKDTVVLCISKDLPFALTRFCAAEGIDNLTMLSDFRGDFAAHYPIVFTDSPLKGLLSRCIVVLDEQGKVVYTEQVAETTNEPNYAKALQAINN